MLLSNNSGAQSQPQEQLQNVYSQNQTASTICKSCIVSSETFPIPGLFVEQILNNEFVEFDNLLPDNLSNDASVKNSVNFGVRKPKEVVPIRGFGDWADAWAVYVAVVAQDKPD